MVENTLHWTVGPALEWSILLDKKASMLFMDIRPTSCDHLKQKMQSICQSRAYTTWMLLSNLVELSILQVLDGWW